MVDLITNDARLLAYLTQFPHATHRQIANSLGITERTVMAIIAKFKKQNVIRVRHVGRGCRRRINLPPEQIDALKALAA